VSCGNSSEYKHIYPELADNHLGYAIHPHEYPTEPDASNHIEEYHESGYRLFYIEGPSSPRPRTVHKSRDCIIYRQITGRIVSIEGLVIDGAIHPDVDWLEIQIEDCNGTPITVIVTRWTVVPFDSLWVGETITAFVSTDTARLSQAFPIYIASVLVADAPEGIGVYVGYFGPIETHIERRGDSFIFYRFADGLYDFTCSDGITRKTDNNTIFAYNRIELLGNPLSDVSDGLVFIYNIPAYETDEPIIITEIHRIADSAYDWRRGREYADFHLPEFFSFSDFEVLDMPIFLQQELFIPSTPPILHHDGITVMIPFMSIGREWPFRFLGVSASLGDSGLWFGTVGGGSGETAQMLVGGIHAGGTGLSVGFKSPTLLVDGVIYAPLIEFFAGVSPALMTDAFIYNNEIHIVFRGWCFLHGYSSRAGWSGLTERPITIDVSQLPIYVNGEGIRTSPPFLADCGYNIMLPVKPLVEALGYIITVTSCGEAIILEGRVNPIKITSWGTEVEEFYGLELEQGGIRWIDTPLTWVDDELYASYWCLFRDILRLGGFASESRIELFHIDFHCKWS